MQPSYIMIRRVRFRLCGCALIPPATRPIRRFRLLPRTHHAAYTRFGYGCDSRAYSPLGVVIVPSYIVSAGHGNSEGARRSILLLSLERQDAPNVAPWQPFAVTARPRASIGPSAKVGPAARRNCDQLQLQPVAGTTSRTYYQRRTTKTTIVSQIRSTLLWPIRARVCAWPAMAEDIRLIQNNYRLHKWASIGPYAHGEQRVRYGHPWRGGQDGPRSISSRSAISAKGARSNTAATGHGPTGRGSQPPPSGDGAWTDKHFQHYCTNILIGPASRRSGTRRSAGPARAIRHGGHTSPHFPRDSHMTCTHYNGPLLCGPNRSWPGCSKALKTP